MSMSLEQVKLLVQQCSLDEKFEDITQEVEFVRKARYENASSSRY